MIPENRNSMHQHERFSGENSLDGSRWTDPEEGLTGLDAQLSQEIEQALSELEIIQLRSELKNIAKQSSQTSGSAERSDAEAYFGLSEEVFNPVNLDLGIDELEMGNYLQKLHIKNHAVASRETVHDMYTEPAAWENEEQDFLSEADEYLFEEISQAVSEREIMDIRANLQSIAQGVSLHGRSTEEIEDYLEGVLDAETERQIRDEILADRSLSNEIKLHGEIDVASGEKDIMRLRSGLQAMMHREYSHTRSTEDIDEYLSGTLEGAGLADFEEEMLSNTGLYSEVMLSREIDKASGEGDVMELRARLQSITEEERGRSSEALGLRPRHRSLFWYAAASSIVLMIVFSSLLRHRNYSAQQLYTTYYQPYRSGVGVSRSAEVRNSEMDQAMREIEMGRYPQALALLDRVPAGGDTGVGRDFYRGVASQELGDYGSAVESFQAVIDQGDNLLTEQSAWYIGLCYLRLEDKQKALQQFRRIAAGGGFYAGPSEKIIERLQ